MPFGPDSHRYAVKQLILLRSKLGHSLTLALRHRKRGPRSEHVLREVVPGTFPQSLSACLCGDRRLYPLDTPGIAPGNHQHSRQSDWHDAEAAPLRGMLSFLALASVIRAEVIPSLSSDSLNFNFPINLRATSKCYIESRPTKRAVFSYQTGGLFLPNGRLSPTKRVALNEEARSPRLGRLSSYQTDGWH